MTDSAALRRHCAELDRCNQRGRRMLSILDLLDAGSMDLDLAAYLMAHMRNGASLMVGARPGGAGKTTVMCALANLVSPGVEIVAATCDAIRSAVGDGILGAGRGGLVARMGGRRCFLCHEIGAGAYFGYQWGADLRAYCSLSEYGHILATNLHADDLEEARGQVCGDNGVPDAHFHAFGLLVFLRVEGGFLNAKRVIDTVYASDGVSPHVLVFDRSNGLRPPEHRPPDAGTDQIERCRRFLQGARDDGVRTIQNTRERLEAEW